MMTNTNTKAPINLISYYGAVMLVLSPHLAQECSVYSHKYCIILPCGIDNSGVRITVANLDYSFSTANILELRSLWRLLGKSELTAMVYVHKYHHYSFSSHKGLANIKTFTISCGKMAELAPTLWEKKRERKTRQTWWYCTTSRVGVQSSCWVSHSLTCTHDDEFSASRNICTRSLAFTRP